MLDLFRKKDEMDLDIQKKSVFVSYYLTQLLLIIWIIISVFMKKNCIIPLYIFMVQFIIRFFVELVYKRLYKDDRIKRRIIMFICILIVSVFFLIVGGI